MDESPHTPREEPSRWVYALSAALLAALLAAWFTLPGFQAFVREAYAVLSGGDEERVSAYVSRFGAWAPLLIVAAMVAQMFLIVVPSWLLMIVAVLAYGPVWGVALSIVAVYVASSVGYVLGRMLGGVTVTRLVGAKGERKTHRFLNRYGLGAVFIFRLTPFLSNDAISLVGGMLRMGYARFITATLAGTFPLAVLIGYFGQNTDRLKRGLFWFGGGGLFAYAVYVVWDHWFRKRNRPEIR